MKIIPKSFQSHSHHINNSSSRNTHTHTHTRAHHHTHTHTEELLQLIALKYWPLFPFFAANTMIWQLTTKEAPSVRRVSERSLSTHS